MHSERLRKVEELYHLARERPAGEREAFLTEACASDGELLRDVLALLAQDSGSGPMGRPVLELAAELLDGSPGVQWTSGTVVGPFEIVNRLGAGGMGEVFIARDTRLGREVAIKVVHEEFSGRFQREARAISALNHPNICTLHDIGPNYLVMELLDGETLADRLRRGRLPMDVVLSWGAQIADALTAAHAKGITHRDLKPANIMVTKQGIKVLDFGLAKFGEDSDPAKSHADSATKSQTILGTPAYMAPEQLEGKPCDARTDIFALGMVLYEMASGRRPFTGDSRAALIAEIMRCQPAPLEKVPLQFQHLIERCLAKNPDDRWQSAREIRLELDFQSRALSGAQSPVNRRRIWPAVLAAVAMAVLAAGVLYFRRGPGEPIVVPLTSYPGMERTPSFSPDGSRVAFAWNGETEGNYDIYVKQVGPGNPVRLTQSSADSILSRWSPDGKWIAFLRRQPNNTSGVYVVPSLGGLERKLGDAETYGFNYWPMWRGCLDWSQDGQWLVITKRPSPGEPPGLALLSFKTGKPRQITRPAAHQYDVGATFTPDGRALSFWRGGEGGGIMVLPLSASLEPLGPPKETAAGKRKSTLIPTLAWANNRNLIFATGTSEYSGLWQVDAYGTSSPRRLSFAGDGASGPAISRRGDRMVFSRFDQEWNIWSLPLDENGQAAGPAVRVFDSTRSEFTPEFSPDGAKVAFASSRSGNDEIWVCRSNGTDCDQLTSLIDVHAGSPWWSPDGNWIAYDVFRWGVWAVEIIASRGGQPRRVGEGQVARWSRDGQRIYFSNLLGVFRVPAAGGERQSVAKGWIGTVQESADEKWLYFLGSINEPMPLRRTPISGGDLTEVLPAVAGRNVIVLDTGIWYMTPNTKEGSLLQFYDFATKSSRTVYHTSRPVFCCMTLSPDRRRILFTQIDRSPNADLMLVENFH